MTTNLNWFTEDLKANPAVGDILADTGPLIAGTYRLTVCVASNVAVAVQAEWRDAANIAIQKRIIYAVPAFSDFCMDLDVITDTDNERVRMTVLLITALPTNRVQGTIMNRA